MMCKGSDELVDGMRQLIQSSLRRNDWQTLIALPFADATVREGEMAYEPDLLRQRDSRVLISLLIPFLRRFPAQGMCFTASRKKYAISCV